MPFVNSLIRSLFPFLYFFFFTLLIMAADDTQGPVVVGICVAFAVITFCVLVLRLFSRVYVLGKMGLDDCKWSVRRH